MAHALAGRDPSGGHTLTFVHPGPADALRPEDAAIGALARTLSAETPALRCRSVRFDALLDAGTMAETVLAAVRDGSAEHELRYGPQGRMVRRWSDCEPGPGEGAVPIREGGVYVIAGGTGGLGLIVADHLARRYRAKIALVGRSPLTGALQARMDEWAAGGADVRHVQADVSRADEAARAVATVRELHGRVDGVVHCAGVNRDGVYFRTNATDIEAVTSPKVRGVRHLDAATQDDDLDFFLLFSSVSTSVPNPGQSGYAFANAYLEAFADLRARRDDRPGRTLAIAWPFWADGGMRVDPDVIARSRTATGLVPMPTADGLDVLTRGLAGSENRLVVLHGDGGRIAELLPGASEPRHEPIPDTSPVLDRPAVGRPVLDRPALWTGPSDRPQYRARRRSRTGRRFRARQLSRTHRPSRARRWFARSWPRWSLRRTTSPSPSWVSPADTPRRPTWTRSGRTSPPGGTASRRSPPADGTTTRCSTPTRAVRARPTASGAGSSTASTGSTPLSSASPAGTPSGWIRRSASS